MKKKKGFSFMELILGFIVIAIITSVSVPILFKKSTKLNLKFSNELSKNCNPSNPSCAAFSNRCSFFKKYIKNGSTTYVCLACKTSIVNSCKEVGKYFDKVTCKCKNCSDFNTKAPFSPSSPCTNCCVRCNKDFCTGCRPGAGLKNRSAKMGCEICPKGTYSDNKDGFLTKLDEACKKCPAGYYCPDKGMENGKKNICPPGSYCPEGSINPITCPAGCYCPEAGMRELKSTSVAGLSCPRGNNDKTYPCPAGCFCPVGMGVLSSVSVGIAGRNLSCPKGNDNNNHPCPKNYYCPIGSKTGVENSCASFRANTVTKYQGASDSTYCVCDKGFEFLSNKCVKCDPGTYKTTVGNSICLNCPQGHECPTSSGEPSKCPCGKFSAGKQQNCTSADAGYYTPYVLVNGEVTYKSQAACTGNTFSQQGACTCSTCASPKVANSEHKACVGCLTKFQNCSKCNYYNCTECHPGYYLNSDNVCKKCSEKYGSNCLRCNKDKCTTCFSGYATNEANASSSNACCKLVTSAQMRTCDPLNAYYIKTDDIEGYGCRGVCVKKQNVGDETGSNKIPFPHPLVLKLDALPASPSADPATYRCPTGKKCCWRGTTTSNCHTVSSYNACNRTVCNYKAANTLCNQNGWRLPTANELNYIFLNMSSEVKVCYDVDEGNNDFCQEKPLACYGADGTRPCPTCPTGFLTDFCHPHGVWGQDRAALSLGSSTLYGISLYREGFAFSVRCVKDLVGGP